MGVGHVYPNACKKYVKLIMRDVNLIEDKHDMNLKKTIPISYLLKGGTQYC